MPGLVPPVTDERALLLAFLGQQRDALRYAAHGLTDEQADCRPSVSALSVAGIIKHVSQVERAWVTFLKAGDSGVFAVTDDYADGFGLVAGETLEDVLALAAEQAHLTEQVVSGIDDLGGRAPTDHRRRALDPGRLVLDAALGAPPPHRRGGTPRRTRRHHP